MLRLLQADGNAPEWPRLQRTADSVGGAVGEDKSVKKSTEKSAKKCTTNWMISRDVPEMS